MKHFSLYLKANNPKNNKYLRDKYTKKLNEFKRHCNLMEEVHADGLRYEDGELKKWQVKNFYQKCEKFSSLLSIIEALKDKFHLSFIR